MWDSSVQPHCISTKVRGKLVQAHPTPSPQASPACTVSSRNLKAHTPGKPALQSRIYCTGPREGFVAHTVRGPQADRTPSQVSRGEAGVESECDRAMVGISVSVKPEFSNCKTLLLDSKTGSSGNLWDNQSNSSPPHWARLRQVRRHCLLPKVRKKKKKHWEGFSLREGRVLHCVFRSQALSETSFPRERTFWNRFLHRVVTRGLGESVLFVYCS